MTWKCVCWTCSEHIITIYVIVYIFAIRLYDFRRMTRDTNTMFFFCCCLMLCCIQDTSYYYLFLLDLQIAIMNYFTLVVSLCYAKFSYYALSIYKQPILPSAKEKYQKQYGDSTETYTHRVRSHFEWVIIYDCKWFSIVAILSI